MTESAAQPPGPAGVRALIAMTRSEVHAFWPRTALVVALSVSLVGPAILVPYLLGTATDVVIRSLREGDLLVAELAVPLSWVAGIALLSATINYWRDRLSIKLIEEWDSSVRARVVAILNGPPGRLDDFDAGDLLSRCVNDLDILTRTASHSLSAATTATVSILGSLAVMLWFDPWFPLVAIGTLAAIAAVSQRLAKRARPYFHSQMEEYGNLTGVVLDAYMGSDAYRSGHNSAGLTAQLADVDQQLSVNAYHSTRLSGAAGPASAVLDSLGFVVIVVIGAFRIASGSLTVGEVQATVQYFRQTTAPVGALTEMLHSIQEATTSARRVMEVLRTDVGQCRSAGKDSSIDLAAGPLAVAFDDVTFRYDDDGANVLSRFSMTLPAGSHAALVGPSGVGKSTVIRLLLAQLRPLEGTVEISGHDVDLVRRESLVARVAVVPQEPWIFTGTITENIRCMRADVSIERVRAIGTRCGLDECIATLPDGYDTVISADGRELPANARRQIGIARALVATPGLVLMDEPTAGMDPVSAARIEKLIADQFRDVTVLVVSHRDSTIAAQDRTILIDDGQPAEI